MNRIYSAGFERDWRIGHCRFRWAFAASEFKLVLGFKLAQVGVRFGTGCKFQTSRVIYSSILLGFFFFLF